MFVRAARWAPANAVLFAILAVAAALVTTDAPGRHASDQTWTAYYADAGHRHSELVAFFLIGFAGLCFLWFLGSLRALLARAEGEPARLATAAVASGATFIALALAAHGVGTAVSFARAYYGSDYTVDADTARLLGVSAYVLFVLAMFAASAMALATSVLAFRSRALPRWLAWLGVLAALGAVLSVYGLPALVTLLWIVALGLWMVARPAGAEPAAITT